MSFSIDPNAIYKELNSIIETKNSILENHIEFLKGEVDTRVESLKNELNDMKEKFYRQIDDLKEKCVIRLNKLQKKKESEDPVYLSLLQKWNNNIENQKLYLDEMKFFNDRMIQYNNELTDLFSKANFEPSVSSFSDEIVGKLESDLILGENIKYRTYKPKPLAETKQASSLCSINDKYILVTDKRANRVIKYNSDYEVLEQCLNVGRLKWNKPTFICTDEVDNIFVCNANSTEVVITDLHFRTVKHVLGSSSDMNANGLEFIKDMKFFDGRLYILDASSSSLHVYEPNGKFLNSIFFSQNPKEHKALANPLAFGISDEMIAILDDHRKIYVYNPTGVFIEKLTSDDIGILQSICVKNDYIFAHAGDGAFICNKLAEENGKKSIQNCFTREISYLREKSEGMIHFNKQIVLMLPYEKAFVTF